MTHKALFKDIIEYFDKRPLDAKGQRLKKRLVALTDGLPASFYFPKHPADSPRVWCTQDDAFKAAALLSEAMEDK